MKLALSITLLCWTALATPIRTIDGDTFTADARVWPGQTNRETVRVRGVNAPERKGETLPAGDASRDFTQAWLSGSEVQLIACARDSFGRLLASVVRTRDSANLADDLVRAGHAVPFKGRTP